MKFSTRISLLYSLCEGDAIWDICCDHSHIALLNLKEKKFKTVFCVDKSNNCLDRIKSHPFYSILMNNENTNSAIELIYKDGCDIDWEKASGSIVIAGVGSHTLLKIVQSCPEVKRTKLTWVLNPFNHPEKTKIAISNIFTKNKIEEHVTIEDGRDRFVFKIFKSMD